MQKTLQQCFHQFEEQLTSHIHTARAEGAIAPKTPIKLHIVGQMALLLSDLPFPLASTTDLDAVGLLEYASAQLLSAILLNIGLTLETDQHLIWMPPHTVYQKFYDGRLVRVDIAQPLYVIASKCKFQREKDRSLIAQFFARYPAARKKISAMHISTTWIDR